MKNVVGLIPYYNKTNLFIRNTIKAIEGAGYTVTNGFSVLNENANYLFLNWFESLPDGLIPRIYFFTKRIIFLTRCKRREIKIVTYFHNRKPHDHKRKLIDKMLAFVINSYADRIIILCEGSKAYASDLFIKRAEEKMFLIPHPNYIGSYPKRNFCEEIGSDEKCELRLLFIGRVKPYKKIEYIIDAARELRDEPITFKVCGYADDGYKQKICDYAKNLDNLTLDLRFVEDCEIEGILEACDIVILPYDESMLNSGTMLLAFSYSRTVIIPNIPAVNDFDTSLLYDFDGTNDNYYNNLIETIKKALNDFKHDKTTIQQKGKKLYEIVRDRNSMEVVIKRYREMLQSIDND